MLLSISTAMPSARVLGHLLRKHPDRVQEFPVSGGSAWVFFPEATDERCTATLLVELTSDGPRSGRGIPSALGGYVNDLPHAAGSMLATAIKQVYGSAMTGKSESFPEVAAAPMDLTITIPVLANPDGPELIHRLFQPLGWIIDTQPIAADPTIAAWGDAPYSNVTLRGSVRLADALTHVYVLLPVLADTKHYWVSADEVDKLMRAGSSWLGAHPERELIARRYLAHQKSYADDALARLLALDGTEDETHAAEEPTPAVDNGAAAEVAERYLTLAGERRVAVAEELRLAGAARVLDIGCGPGALLAELLRSDQITELVGTDVSARALTLAAKRLHLDNRAERPRVAIDLFSSSVVYRDERLRGYDAAVLMEVIEHVDPPRLPALAASVFGDARPGTVIVTTPNADYNPLYPSLPAGQFRHPDHRFEWSRDEFASWATGVADQFGYLVQFRPVGAVDAQAGPPTQMAVFTRSASGREA